MIVHATTPDWTEWTGEAAPANLAVLLRMASRLVDSALLTAVYDVDSDGRATDPGVLAALSDATCAQATTWAALGVNPVAGPADLGPAPVSQKQLGSASFSYDTSAAASVTVQQSRAAAISTLCAEAVQILTDARLLTTRVGYW